MTHDAVVMVAPNGARRTKTDHPNLPITVEEIAKDVGECAKAGACAAHVHVRDASGAHVLDAGLYREALAAIADTAHADLVVQITTEAVGRYTPDQQMALVDAVEPDAVSIAVRELFPPSDATLERSADFVSRTLAAGTAIQFIVYDRLDYSRFTDLSRREVIPAGPTLLFVAGRYGEARGDDAWGLHGFLNALHVSAAANGGTMPAWMACGFGRAETAVLTASLAFGGHVRVGFENAVVGPTGDQPASNAQQVARFVQLAPMVGRPIADREATLRVLGKATEPTS